MANYAPSTRARIADLILGMRVDTSNVDVSDLVHLHQAQVEDFNVYGTILLMNIFMEVEVVLGTAATTFQYNYSNVAQSITATALGAASSTISDLAVGARVIWGGGAVAGSNHQMTGSVGVSDLAVGVGVPQVIGFRDATSTIGHLTGAADMLTGTVFHSLFYVPMSAGAYVEAAY